MKRIYSILLLAILSISCQSEKDKQTNEKSQLVFNKSVEKIKKSYYEINIDSFRVLYEKYKTENPQTGLDFANRFEVYSDKLLQKRQEIELAQNSRETQRKEREIKKEADERKIWENSKFGKLQKKHPNWTDDECMDVMNKKIWIGMSLEMLKYQRGIPDRANPSDYGNGTKWQWCWDDYTPSCFYGENGVITSYN